MNKKTIKQEKRNTKPLDRVVHLVVTQEELESQTIKVLEQNSRLLKDENLDTELIMIKANQLLAAGDILMAITTYTRGLKRYPTHIGLQIAWNGFGPRIHKAFIDHCNSKVRTHELPKIYERLNFLGLNGYSSHFLALRQMIDTQNWNQAVTLAKKLLRGAPGLQATLPLLQSLPKDVIDADLKKLMEKAETKYHINVKDRNCDQQLAHHLLNYYKKLVRYYNQENYMECLTICKQVLPKDETFDLTFLNFYHLEAIALEGLGKIDEAAEKFLRIRLAAANWLPGLKSYEIAMDNLIRYAERLSLEQPESPAISKYFTLLSKLTYVPLSVFRAHLDQLVKKPECRDEIEELLIARSELFPYDNDTISLLFRFGRLFGNNNLLQRADNYYETALEKRPWDLELLVQKQLHLVV